MSVRTLLAMVVALAVLFAPTFTRAGEAFAAVPDHHAQMMQAGHCQAPPAQPGDHHKAPAKSCCISMCMAVAITPASPLVEKVAQRAPAVFGVASFHVNSPAELATPPPKLA